jgi:tryptophan 7-halogenase
MNIVVVGGGTAGWLTALYAKKVLDDNANITVIESESIGILGAGEGSTSQLPPFLSLLDIDVSDLINSCNASIKNGIKFSGWSNKDYFYSFPSYGALGEHNFYFPYYLSLITPLHCIFAAKNGDTDIDYQLVPKMSRENKVPFFFRETFYDTDIFPGMEIVGDFGLHFDARLLADYLKDVAISRGIVREEGIVQKINNDSQGNVSSLLVDSGIEVESDFVFDATGFRRLIIGEHYKSEWQSFGEHLPAKRALPFFTKEDIPPYTEAVAMDAGWMWKIPLQNRMGNGYVFDSDYLTDDEAHDEIVKKVGYEVEHPTVFSFEAGAYKKVWIKNVLAVGLAAGFVEPLEATSIWQTTKTLQRFFGDPNSLTINDDGVADIFNKTYVQETESIVSFLYLHYLVEGTGSKFWKEFQDKNKPTELISNILSVVNKRPLYDEIDFHRDWTFNAYDYNQILTGTQIFDQAKLKAMKIHNEDTNQEKYDTMKSNQNQVMPMLDSHSQFLQKIKNKEDNNG